MAFRPKTHRAYESMFRTFVAFCLFTKSSLIHINVKVVLSFLECLVANECSASMIANYVSAIKASFIMYDLPFETLDHPKVKYFLKALRINRPITTTSHNVITISHLLEISKPCDFLTSPQVYRATFLLGFFAFLRLSNLAPHARADFDHTRHLTGNDVFFTEKYLKVLLKWSKTMQTRDKVQCITLPKLKIKPLCPFRAVKALFKLYPMSGLSPLPQIQSDLGSNPLTDSQVRKSLKTINVHLGLSPAFFTFHDFRQSGATYAFNSHIPIQQIKRHGTWSSDCVWGYIQSDHTSGESLADALAGCINA